MTIRDLTPDELRHYIRNHHEKTYRIVDVRQAGEYEFGHIPGALSIPLPQLMIDAAALPTDKTLIFYCRSGARSTAAAVMADEENLASEAIYNLEGGIMAWDGATVADMPRVALFDLKSTAEMMSTAIALEKGALRFYSHVRSKFGAYDWSEIFGRLGKAEAAHAKTVYGFWQKINDRLEPFDQLFEQLSGDVLEGGRSLNEVLSEIERQKAPACIGLIEMALQMEYSAYDLYRTMTEQSEEPEAAEAFMALAQAEKSHMRALADALEKCE